MDDVYVWEEGVLQQRGLLARDPAWNVRACGGMLDPPSAAAASRGFHRLLGCIRVTSATCSQCREKRWNECPLIAAAVWQSGTTHCGCRSFWGGFSSREKSAREVSRNIYYSTGKRIICLQILCAVEPCDGDVFSNAGTGWFGAMLGRDMWLRVRFWADVVENNCESNSIYALSKIRTLCSLVRFP